MSRIATICALIVATLAGAAMAADRPPTPPAPSFINLALNVSNIDKSVKFYVEALGFTDGGAFTPDPTGAKVYGLPKLDMKVHNLRLGAISILMREFVDPKYAGKTGNYPINQLGLGNIAVSVKNMDEAVAAVKRLGGTIDENTRALRAGVGPLMVFGTDPDGIRIELLQF
jgi:catechol 2,3-dioxygenase-like lactoylglutathione lyase family enzyme